MGFVRVTCEKTGKVISDSRRNELSAESAEYVEWLREKIAPHGNEELKSRLVEIAIERELAEQQTDSGLATGIEPKSEREVRENRWRELNQGTPQKRVKS